MELYLEYEKMINELKSIDKISITKNDFYKKDELLPGFIEQHPELINDQDVLLTLNDNFFSWSIHKEGDYSEYPMGELHFMSAEEVFASSNKKTFSVNTNQQKSSNDFYFFDDHPNGGDGIMAGFFVKNAGYEIWLHNETGQMFKMNVNLEDYIRNTFSLKAIYGWQYLFIDINWSKLEFNVVKKDLNNRLKILLQLFPNTDYSKYLLK